MMRANRKSYATGAVRAWLKGRHKIRLQQQPFRILVPLRRGAPLFRAIVARSSACDWYRWINSPIVAYPVLLFRFRPLPRDRPKLAELV